MLFLMNKSCSRMPRLIRPRPPYRSLNSMTFWGSKRPWKCKGAVHKVRHAIFGQCWPPPPFTLCHTSRDPPKSTSHISESARFLIGLVQKPGQKPPVQILSQLFAGVFIRGILSGVFCLEGLSGVVFVRSPFCQNTSVTTESSTES